MKYIILGLLLSVISCQTKLTESRAITQKFKPIYKGFSVTDSLTKYSTADSTLLVDDSLRATLFIGKANRINYAVWVADSTLVFYQHLPNQKWIATDTIQYELDFSFAKNSDLNADNLEDVKIGCYSGANGNTENIVFLFDNKTNQFKHNPYYDLPNVALDKQRKFIKSWWFAGVAHGQDKQKYRITGDSITFDAGVTYCPNEMTHGNTATLEFYTETRTKRIVLKRMSGKADKLWHSFNKAFWDTSDE